MAPTPFTNTFEKRDATLSAGGIAGIIVGIVVVSLILLGLLIWRLLAYRKNIDPYSAKSLDSRAREKALSQVRGEHVRSTRPRDRDTTTMDENRGLVSKQSHGNEEEEVLQEGGEGGDIDSHSINGTVQDDDQAMSKARLNEKRMDQERDMEIYQGHHAAAAAPSANYGFSHEADAQHLDANPQRRSTDEKKQSVLRGCTTM
jgi:cytoskeletal protein RodZ